MGRPPGFGGPGSYCANFLTLVMSNILLSMCATWMFFFGKQPQSAQLQLLHAKFVQMGYGRGWPVCPVAQPLKMLTVFQLLKPRPQELTCWVNFALRCVVLRCVAPVRVEVKLPLRFYKGGFKEIELNEFKNENNGSLTRHHSPLET